MNEKNGKKIIVKYENTEYVWHNHNWITLRNNLTVSTSLAQRLVEYAIKTGILTQDDFITTVEKKTKG